MHKRVMKACGISREQCDRVTQRSLVFVRIQKTHCGSRILDETHTLRYSIHPGSTKMYHELRQQFWWMRMKHETTRCVSECETCQKVKADYMKAGGLLQPLSIPDWMWYSISMDFIVGFPLTACKFDSIWVIMDRLTKSAHFIPVNSHYNV
jgi:hypothetical protein